MDFEWAATKFRRSLHCIASAVLLCCIATQPCRADKSIFCGAADQLKKIQFIPIAQMDDEMLIESVADIMDGGMSSEQRLLNHYWMMLEGPQTLNGSRALNRLIVLSLTSYKDDSWHSIGPNKSSDDSKERSAIMGFFGDYHLQVSSNSVVLGFHKRFK